MARHARKWGKKILREKQNVKRGFTLVEVIVVLVVLAILAAIMIPAMTGWIDKAKERRLITACRTCVTAAQTLASEAYGVDGTDTEPSPSDVLELAGITGAVSDIEFAAGTVQVHHLTYSDGTDSVKYCSDATCGAYYNFNAGRSGIASDGMNWTSQLVAAMLAKRANTQMNADSDSPKMTDADMKTYGYGNWADKTLLALAKTLYPDDANVTAAAAVAKLKEANVQTWAIRNADNGKANAVLLSDQNIESASAGDYVRTISCDLTKTPNTYKIGYAKVYTVTPSGAYDAYNTLGSGDRAWTKDFVAYTAGATASYDSYEAALADFNSMPLEKP